MTCNTFVLHAMMSGSGTTYLYCTRVKAFTSISELLKLNPCTWTHIHVLIRGMCFTNPEGTWRQDCYTNLSKTSVTVSQTYWGCSHTITRVQSELTLNFIVDCSSDYRLITHVSIATWYLAATVGAICACSATALPTAL